jgi:hypothetical protein
MLQIGFWILAGVWAIVAVIAVIEGDLDNLSEAALWMAVSYLLAKDCERDEKE